ncbi:GNAT family N-acetyltransferase [Niallia sp. Man26]|uniref:GNAT family N-acetyltransferase n=1 Tax=Niallia sp. Man26 TaxID=2912824 RepID=UPI001EDBDD15|nr:GNAT family N-acetyltransferase [Niallia sp. Man26]UPO86110.1 GNAT family N-acetyltransferase [Niallia sp. Man26]
MQVRVLKPKDAKDYWNLRLTTLKQHPDAFLLTVEEEQKRLYPIKRITALLKDPTRVTIGAFMDERLVGSITLQKETYKKIKHKASVLSFFIEDDFRNKGIGKRLLTEVITLAKRYEIEQLLLAVVSTNAGAIALYESFGFTVFGLEKNALKVDGQYFDEQHMIFYLSSS